jgi:hypothetical protein
MQSILRHISHCTAFYILKEVKCLNKTSVLVFKDGFLIYLQYMEKWEIIIKFNWSSKNDNKTVTVHAKRQMGALRWRCYHLHATAALSPMIEWRKGSVNPRFGLDAVEEKKQLFLSDFDSDSPQFQTVD